MKRLLILLVLLCQSFGAAAQWTPVMLDEMVITYIDRNTQRGKGGMVKMWWLVDYQLVQITNEKGYFSRVQYSEYDCRQRRSRVMSVALMSQPMGHGETVFEDRLPRKWESVQGQPFMQALWDIACVEY
ncbi:MAG TPA: surface-adhesin E family protein [Polaromonas sp.]|uniref:surface-adhesin E family protein n=1 Tax=Polaromonas sp. TaxID=1869339 RepID=UPI002D49E77A|nr:surface-adhesin E family protein [Polaromonas sp.]HYW58332.1 surface-adhesin E family protein [Polaromonas sp.]